MLNSGTSDESTQTKIRRILIKNFASEDSESENSVYHYLPAEIAEAVLGEKEFSCKRCFELLCYGEVETPVSVWNDKGRGFLVLRNLSKFIYFWGVGYFLGCLANFQINFNPSFGHNTIFLLSFAFKVE